MVTKTLISGTFSKQKQEKCKQNIREHSNIKNECTHDYKSAHATQFFTFVRQLVSSKQQISINRKFDFQSEVFSY